MTQTAVGKFDISSQEWANSSCAWCHPGGGNLEYDRAGYRYDDKPSGLLSGTVNPNKDAHKGDYFTIGTNATTKKPEIQSRVAVWQNGGVAEADCLMCHLNMSSTGANARYAYLERNYVVFEPPSPAAVADDPKTLKGLKNAATMGLARTSLITGVTLGSAVPPATNPSLSGWSWTGSGDVVLSGTWISESKKENCAICHFPDRSWFGPSGSANRGPIDSPLGFTSYQKLVTTTSGAKDDDFVTPANITTNWSISNGRTEGTKRGESINDPVRNQCVNSATGDPITASTETACATAGGAWIRTGNPDAHMKTGGMTACSTCHYALEGNFPAKKDGSGTEILPAIKDVQKIDHQFAKGNAFPDTKNMDQMDYTATCESCHITGTHPNKGTAQVPQHIGLPAIHLNKIACRTCHSPVLNGPVLRLVSDFTAGPFRGFARVQSISKAGTGIGFKPLYMWQNRKDGIKIVPAGTTVSPVWANNIDGTIVPTFQRMARAVAVNYRAAQGDANNDGRYDWTLNAAQGGTTAMIVNTVSEIDGFIDRMKNPGNYTWATQDGTAPFGAVSNPVLNMYVNYFSISHNVQPIARDANGKPIPGEEITYYTYDGRGLKTGEFKRKLGPLGINGCIECHSSSNPSSPNYSPKSMGFFDKTHELFAHAEGVKQVEINGAKKVNLKPSFIKGNGTPNVIDLGSRAAHGGNIPNTLSQTEVLGYNTDAIAKLTSPIGTTRPQARLKVARVKDDPATTTVDESARGLRVSFTDVSLCPSGNCTKELKVGTMNAGTCGNLANASFGEHTFTLAPGVWKGSFCAQLSVTDTVTGLNSTRTFPINLTKRNTRPTTTGDAIPATGTTGTPISINSDFTVADDDDAKEALRVLIVWGDGTSITVNANANGTVTASKTYTVAKTYNVRITVIDTKGGRTRVTEEITVSAP